MNGAAEVLVFDKSSLRRAASALIDSFGRRAHQEAIKRAESCAVSGRKPERFHWERIAEEVRQIEAWRGGK